MNDLKTFVEEQEIQEPQSERKYKILGIGAVLLVLYVAYCCVHMNFKVFIFLNDIAYYVLSMINSIVLLVSDLIRELFMMF